MSNTTTTGNTLMDAYHAMVAKKAAAADSAKRSADSAESFGKRPEWMSEDADKHLKDNTEEMLIDAMRSTMAVAYGYLWHITTSDKRILRARHMLRDMIEASGLTPEEFRDIRRYGIQEAKNDGCVANAREAIWGDE